MKKIRKNILANGLAMALAFSNLPIYSLESEKIDDIEGHWAESYMRNFVREEILEGYENGLLNPDEDITRAEFVKIVNATFGFTDMGEEEFEDVGEEDWYYENVAIAVKQGYIIGYEDGTFRPNEKITREEVCKIIGFILKAEGDGKTNFKDEDQIAPWAIKYVDGLVDMGILNGYEDGTFRPKGNTTRAESAKTLYVSKQEYTPEVVVGGSTTQAPTTQNPTTPTTPQTPTESETPSESQTPTTPTEPETPSETPTEKAEYTISFYLNYDGATTDSKIIVEGEKLEKPTEPTREGYIFSGWFIDEDLKIEFDFDKEVTSNYILYAKWESSADISLNASENDVMIGNNQKIYLSVDSSSKDTKELTENTISVYESKTGKEVATLYDDGTNGDDIKNDGIYNGYLDENAIIIDKSKDLTLELIAKDGEKISNIITINYYATLTDTQLAQMNAVDEKIDEVLEIKDFYDKSDEEKVELVQNALDSLEESGNIVENSIEYDKDNNFFSFEYTTGILGGVMIDELYSGIIEESEEFEAKTNILTKLKEKISALLNSRDSATVDKVGNAIILNAFPAFETEDSKIKYRTEYYNELEKAWEAQGLDTTIDTTVTVSDFKKLSNYNVVCISTHGTTVRVSGIPTPVICLAEGVTQAKDTEYALDLKSQNIAKINGSYWILPSFFENNYSKNALANTFVFSEACESMGKGEGSNRQNYDEALAYAILSRSAKAYVGFHNSVLADYSRLFMTDYVDSLIDGNTSIESFNKAVAENGSNHAAWFEKKYGYTYKYYMDYFKQSYNPLLSVAYPVHNGTESAVLVDSKLKNGDFDLYDSSTTLPKYWNGLGDARTMKQLGDVVPKDGTRMAVITTGLGSKTTDKIGSTEGSILYQTFKVPQGISQISFDYNFVSEEPMEYVNSEFNDNFVVNITDSNDNVMYTKMYESINSSTWIKVNGIDFAGGDDTVYQTGWKSETIDVSAYNGKIITLKFIVYDVGDSLYDSACFIDNVVLK